MSKCKCIECGCKKVEVSTKNPWTGTDSKQQGGTLENWFWSGKSIIGQVYGDPRGNRGMGADFSDGSTVITSTVQEVIKVNGKDTEAATLNTVYKLGKPLNLHNGNRAN